MTALSSSSADSTRSEASSSSSECEEVEEQVMENGGNKNKKIETKSKVLTPEEESGALSNFDISPEIVTRLNAKGITHLFPIQQKVYKPITEGNHVIAKARTGSGKTLAFLLPIFQILHSDNKNKSNEPRALILVPTRELANQIASVAAETVKSLRALAIYGGASISQQQRSLQRGVDIVIGTPGRVKDLIDRGSLNFKCISHCILDEVDRMLDMGFKDAVQEILDLAKEASAKNGEIQFLFFSATLTPWVTTASKRYMKGGAKKVVSVDLVGNDNMKTSKDVKHLAVSCQKNSQPAVINDLIRMYSTGKDAKTIIFCQRKLEADELVMSADLKAHKSHVLHGDIPQNKREIVIKGFKEGSINVLIATDVAARGLDIPKIDLVIQCSPPTDLESYVHRSGRTGRAGKKGVAICIYTPRESGALSRVEHFSKFKFERINPPSSIDLIDSIASETFKQLQEVQPEISSAVLKNIKSHLEGQSLEDVSTLLAKAICLAAGVTEERSQSLLNNAKGVKTLLMTLNRPANSQGLYFVKLRDQIDAKLVSSIQTFQLAQDRQSFAFDVEESKVDTFMQQWIDTDDCSLKIANKLPKLMPNTTNHSSGPRSEGGRFGGNRQNGNGMDRNNRFNKSNNFNGGGNSFGRGNSGGPRRGPNNFANNNNSQSGGRSRSFNFNGAGQNGGQAKRVKFD